MSTDKKHRPRQAVLTTLRAVANAVGGRFMDDYSGRGMYGKTCPAIDCDNAQECVEEAAAAGVRGAQTDQLGKGYVVYWPSINTTEEN